MNANNLKTPQAQLIQQRADAYLQQANEYRSAGDAISEDAYMTYYKIHSAHAQLEDARLDRLNGPVAIAAAELEFDNLYRDLISNSKNPIVIAGNNA